jgi:hypothetical protein
MPTATYPAGRVPLGGAQNQISITAVTSIVLPTPAQRRPVDPNIALFFHKTGVAVLEMWLTLEAQNARMTTDGSTPSGTNGQLLIAGTAGPFVFLGERLLSSMKFISPIAGGLISYSFYFIEAV